MTISITGISVWDGIANASDPGPWTLRIEAGRITELLRGTRVSPGSEVFHLDHATALPGLIDAHVHLTLDPKVASPDDQLAMAPADVSRASADRAREMVRAGITTARDLGGGKWLELDLRDRIDRGEVPGPRLLCAGQPVTIPGGHCHFWGGQADGAAEIPAVVARQVEHGSDWIKVMATGGVFTKGTDPGASQFSAQALERVVAEASSHGRAVAAHCHGTVGIRDAARAGVRTIEHCSFAGSGGFGSDLHAGVVETIAASGACVSPTVNVGWARRQEKEGGPTRFFQRMSHALRSLRAAGVPLIASTDAGIPGVAHHLLPESLVALSRYAGLSPVDTLRAATSASACVLGLGNETGALKPGLAADVLVVSGNPLADLTRLSHPMLVLARGVVVFEAPGARGRATGS